MTRTATFYTHVSDKENFTGRLIRTVYDTGVRLVVLCTDADQAARLSDALWVHEDNSFLAHETHRAGTPFPIHAPVVLVQSLPEHDDCATVLNLSTTPCTAPQIQRVLEIVGADEAELATARTRFSVYRQAGFVLEHHQR